jgi:hypothetical protein
VQCGSCIKTAIRYLTHQQGSRYHHKTTWTQADKHLCPNGVRNRNASVRGLRTASSCKVSCRIRVQCAKGKDLHWWFLQYKASLWSCNVTPKSHITESDAGNNRSVCSSSCCVVGEGWTKQWLANVTRLTLVCLSSASPQYKVALNGYRFRVSSQAKYSGLRTTISVRFMKTFVM